MTYFDFSAAIWLLLTRWRALRTRTWWPASRYPAVETARADCAVWAADLTAHGRARAYLRAARLLVDAADELVTKATGQEGELSSLAEWWELEEKLDELLSRRGGEE